MNVSTTIIRPVRTEKSLHLAGREKRYTFVVDRRATKTQIGQAVEERFGVTVRRVNTAITKGGTRRLPRSRARVERTSVKRAIVTVSANQRISALEEKEE